MDNVKESVDKFIVLAIWPHLFHPGEYNDSPCVQAVNEEEENTFSNIYVVGEDEI